MSQNFFASIFFKFLKMRIALARLVLLAQNPRCSRPLTSFGVNSHCSLCPQKLANSSLKKKRAS